MQRLKIVTMITVLLVLALFGLGSIQASPVSQEPPPSIRLLADTFTPALGEQPDIPPGLAIAGYAAGQRGYYIVQFGGPIQSAWKTQLTNSGAEILAYVPDYAFKVRMAPGQVQRVERMANVVWVGLFHPAYKLSPDLRLDGTHLYRLRIEQGANRGLTRAAIATTGAQVLNAQGNILLVGADANQVTAIAHVVDVAWVENFVLKETHNEFGAGVIMGANTANASGYDGSTQIAAVADTGIGGGAPNSAHADIPSSRVTAIYDWPATDSAGCWDAIPDGAQDVDSGHGTHTAVSVLGDGGTSGEGKGTAPGASLVFQAVEDYADMYSLCGLINPDGYYLLGLPADLRDLYQQAYNAGARIHSNSWGSDAAGDYTLDSANTDDFIWNNPDMTITFSAGNEGVDNNNDGVVDSDSIGSPATAKNVITVGASEGERSDNFPCDAGLGYTSHDAYQTGETCTSMGGTNNLGTAGERWGFSTEPLASDITAGNAAQMAPFSSRGPTDDSRIKPDIVAPGTWILSGYSGLYQEGYGGAVNPQNGLYQWDGWGMPLNLDYKYMGGTSMSNPLAAGAATVVRDFYQKAHTHAASAALVKATLINTAVDLLDENNDGADDNDYPIPNDHEGWGRVDLANATDNSHQFVDDATGLSTGSSATHLYGVSTGGQPLRVTLVWSDAPSTESAAQNLVNDLDLIVTDPGGAQYRGNVFSGGWSQTGGNADSVNNVENVYVQSAASGTWTVEVSGANVPNGPQPFALVVDANFGAVNNPPVVTITAPADDATFASGATINFAGMADDVEDGDITASVQWTSDLDGPIGTGGSFNATLSDGVHSITAAATDSGGATGTDAISITVGDPPQPATVHVGDLDGSSAEAPRGRWEATVTITVHDSSEAIVSGALVEGSWSNGASGSDSCTTDASGQCDVIKGNLKSNVSSVTFSVSNLTSGVGTYAAGDNHDADSDNGTSITVSQPGSNTPPTVSIASPTDGTTFTSGELISFAGTASDAEDGDITASLVWTSDIDGEIGTGGSFSADSLSDGVHTITAEATDSAGAASSDGISITVGDPPPPVTVHIGDLDGSSTAEPHNRWSATVTVTVHDASDNPVAGATVDGSWSGGANGGGSCTTDGTGVCTITKGNLKNNASSATFTVNDVAVANGTYDSGANHDPDGDSNGTTITIAQP